jgi:electron transfer flavoprotein alpha subunit
MATEGRRLGERLGATVGGVLVGAPDEATLGELEGLGLETIWVLGNGLGRQTPDSVEHSLVRWWRAREPEALLFAATPLGSELAARVAARTSAGFVANVVDYERGRTGPLRLRRSAFQGKVHFSLALAPERPWVLTIHPASLEVRAAPSAKKARIVRERDTLAAAELALDFRGSEQVSLEEMDIREASVVVGVGRGVANEEILSLVRELAGLLRAPIGGSRVAVEMGLVPPQRQIGLSGQTIDAEVYVACGISGATHHLMGIRGVRHVVAINRDKNAPIFGVAEIGFASDLRDALPPLIEELKAGGAPFGP